MWRNGPYTGETGHSLGRNGPLWGELGHLLRLEHNCVFGTVKVCCLLVALPTEVDPDTLADMQIYFCMSTKATIIIGPTSHCHYYNRQLFSNKTW